jgi:hypothetical protein
MAYVNSFHCVSSFNFWISEPIFIKLGTYITAPEPIWAAYLKYASQKFSRLCVYVATLWLCKNVTAAANTHTNRKYVGHGCVSYVRKFCGSVCCPAVVRERPGKHVPTATRNCWRRRFLCGPCRIKVNRRLVLTRTYCTFMDYVMKLSVPSLNFCTIYGMVGRKMNDLLGNIWKDDTVT